MTAPTRRLKACVENWPGCVEGDYNPACCRFPKSCSCEVYDPATITDDRLEPMTTQPAGEHHTGNLDLTGEGNAEPQPLRSVIDYLTDAARRVNWKPDDKHPLQARYDALRSLMSIYAYATLVSLETLQRTDPDAADRVAEHLSHDDWDVRAECALLWHESLTGGARYAPCDEELHLLAGHHEPTEAAEVKALVETATRLGRELGRREALDRESMIDALEAEWLRNSKTRAVGSPRSFCVRLADALIAAGEIGGLQ